MGALGQRFAAGVVTLIAAVAAYLVALAGTTPTAALGSGSTIVSSPVAVAIAAPEQRTIDSYQGLGTWVDGFDYSPAYSSTGVPPLVPAAVGEMAEAGVSTLYLQSGRLDDRSPGLLEDPWLLAEFVLRAHQLDIDVVAWYLPKWTEDSTDLDHLLAAHEFEVLGQRFDGVAIDIEWNQAGLEWPERNRRLLELAAAVDAAVAPDPVGAIVLPPVQIEVVNPSLWPSFPWLELAPLVDVWMPMSYWSFRGDPYGNGYTYVEESDRRLRNNLGDPDAVVHSIGGIGAEVGASPSGVEPYVASINNMDEFVTALVDTGAFGGSIYDWMTVDVASRQRLTQRMAEAGLLR